MNEYKITDYGIFSDAISSTNNYNSKIGEAKKTIEESQTTLQNEAVFKGPIQENCITEFKTLLSEIDGLSTNMTSMISLIKTTDSNYQAGDAKASGEILGSTTTSNPTISTNGLSSTNFSSKISTMNTPTKDEIIAAAKKVGLTEDYAKTIIGTTQNEGYTKDSYLSYGWASAMINNPVSKETIYGWGGGNDYYSEANINKGYENASDETLKSVYLALTERNTKIIECNGMYSQTPAGYNELYKSSNYGNISIYEKQ